MKYHHSVRLKKEDHKLMTIFDNLFTNQVFISKLISEKVGI